MHTFVLLLHIIGAGILLGVVLFSLALSIRGSLTLERLKIIKLIRVFGPFGAGFLVLTGLYLYFTEADQLQENFLFWIKIALFLIDGTLALMVINRKIAFALAEQEKGGAVRENKLSFWILINTVFILTIISLGVVIAER